MNYIKQLQQENIESGDKINKALLQIIATQVFLSTDKFIGYDEDGDRKDWVSVADVQRMLETIKDELRS